jgi:hypothetical protein
MSIRRLCCAAICAAFATHGMGAHADEQAAPGARVVVLPGEGRLPVPYVDRGITNPSAILSVEVDPDISHVHLLGYPTDTIGTLGAGAGYSFTDDFGMRATAFVLQFNEPFQLDSGALGATYRLIKGPFELALALDWIYQAPATGDGSSGQIILPSVPMHIHFGHRARLDITPTLPISTAGIYIPPIVAEGGGETTVGLDVPLQLSIQVVDQLHLGVGTGFSLTFNPGSSAIAAPPNPPFRYYTVGDTFFIPLGFEIGATIPGPHGPILDMTPFFYWPGLLVPGAEARYNVVESGSWLAGVRFTGFIYL